MSLEAAIHGALSGTGADVNAARQLKVVPETDASANPENVGSVRMFSENDPGAVTGTALLRSPETSTDSRMRVGTDTLLAFDDFDSTTQNTTVYAHTFNTLTVSLPSDGMLAFSTVQGTSSAHGAFLRTYQTFSLMAGSMLWYEFTFGQVTAAMVANEVYSDGFGQPTTATGLPTDGVWMQLTTAGLIGRTCLNGVFNDSGVLKAFGDFAVGTIYRFLIGLGKNEVEWWMDDGTGMALLGVTARPSGSGQPTYMAGWPVFKMKHNTGSVSNSNRIRCGSWSVTLADMASSLPFGHQMALMSRSLYVGHNGATQGKTSWWTNNTAPTPAAATNTAAISGATTLGGLVSVQPTLTANNDGILFTYTNPAASLAVPGTNAVITGVKVQGAVASTLTGGPVIYAYALAYGHTADSLATTETGSFGTGTTHAPRVEFVGMESYAANAAAGTLGQGCTLDLSAAPIVVRPGERIALIARNIGTVTSGGHITVGFTPLGYRI